MVNLQDKIIDNIIAENLPVTVYVTNGVPIRCKILGYDKFTILLDVDGKQQLVYKKVVSTIK